VIWFSKEHRQPLGSLSSLFARASGAESMQEEDIKENALILAVITGLPGIGKSYFLKKLVVELSRSLDPIAQTLRGRFCMVQKDEITFEARSAKRGKPRLSDIIKITMDRLRKVAQEYNSRTSPGPSRQPLVLVFNMNINRDWLQALSKSIREEGYFLTRTVLLSPSKELTFQQLQAAAVVLSTDVRTGEESKDEASTLSPSKAWKVLTSKHFSNSRVIASPGMVAKIVHARDMKKVKRVHYPVPRLNSSVYIHKNRIPKARPTDWKAGNLDFPSDLEVRTAISSVFRAFHMGIVKSEGDNEKVVDNIPNDKPGRQEKAGNAKNAKIGINDDNSGHNKKAGNVKNTKTGINDMKMNKQDRSRCRCRWQSCLLS